MFGLQRLLPVERAPGQQAGVATSVFRGGKRLDWQGHTTGPSSRCQLCGTCRPTLFKNTELRGAGWDTGCALWPGGSGSFPSPSFRQMLAGF